MFGECHMHIFMNGVNYRRSGAASIKTVCRRRISGKSWSSIRRAGLLFCAMEETGLACRRARRRSLPEYGIAYRTPIFAIHKKGHYGGIVGYGFEDWRELP